MDAKRDLCELTLQSSSLATAAQAEPPGLFLCVHCGREFYNSRAFGGHQNAHKEERSLAMRRLDIITTTRGHAATLSSSFSAPQDAAGFFPAANKVWVETRGRSAPDCGSAPRTGDGLDLSLRL